MKRTTVFLYEQTECDLKALARQQGRPVADMVREAIAEYVTREKQKARRPLRFVGIGRSGHTDTAERHEALLFADLVPHQDAVSAPRRATVRRRSAGRATPAAAAGKRRR